MSFSASFLAALLTSSLGSASAAISDEASRVATGANNRFFLMVNPLVYGFDYFGWLFVDSWRRARSDTPYHLKFHSEDALRLPAQAKTAAQIPLEVSTFRLGGSTPSKWRTKKSWSRR